MRAVWGAYHHHPCLLHAPASHCSAHIRELEEEVMRLQRQIGEWLTAMDEDDDGVMMMMMLEEGL